MPPEQRLQLSVGLPARNAEALANLLEQLYDPASPAFRKFLTPEQFAARFGALDEDYNALSAFLEQQGLAIVSRHPNRLVLDITGTVGQVEKVFHVQLIRYQHPIEAREFYAPDVEPSLDFAVPIADISGLNNFVIPRPASLFTKPIPQGGGPRPLSGSGPAGSYIGFDYRAAYAPGVALNGSGQYAGLLQFDGYYPSDIATYVSRVPGLTNVALTNILLNGFSGDPGVNNIEVAMDIELAISMAPGLRAVLVYEGTEANSIISRIANDNLAKQVSASWSYTINVTTSTLFQQLAAQGQSFFNASGDLGAYVGTPDPPLDNPYITCVGGTTLSTRGPGQGWLSETAWNWYSTHSGTNGTGGGYSTSVFIPPWQRPVDMTANGGSAFTRNSPDVAMVADNVFIIANNGQEIPSGGTSAAAPLWAGYLALANQQAALAGQPSVGFINPVVYAVGQGSSYASAFHDIRTGNNTNPASPTAFYAVTGYDLCTGWGTPSSKALINALSPPANRPVLLPQSPVLTVETCSPANGAVDPGEAVVMNFPLQNLGGVTTTNVVATLLATNGLVPSSGPQSYGAIASGTTVNRAFAFIATGACMSVASAVFQLQDGGVDLGLVSFNVPLGPPSTGVCCTPSTNADLAVSQSTYPGTVNLGEPAAYTVTVKSQGPGPATAATLTNTLPANATLDYATPGYTNLGGALVWNLGLMPLGRVTNMTVLVRPTSPAPMTNTAAVASSVSDPISTNNVFTAVINVFLPPPVIDPSRISYQANEFSLTVTGLVGVSYSLEYKDALTDPAWQSVGPTVPGNGAAIVLQDTNSPLPTIRYYRVSAQ